jgi:Kef-type K+ transport system membrane component KefB
LRKLAECLSPPFLPLGLVGLVLRRLRLPLIPCYLITGALIGPGAFGLIGSDDSISSITGLAMVMLMFTIGLHLDPSSVGSGALRSLAVGVASTLAVVLTVWFPASLLGGSWASGLALAMAAALKAALDGLAFQRLLDPDYSLEAAGEVLLAMTQALLGQR